MKARLLSLAILSLLLFSAHKLCAQRLSTSVPYSQAILLFRISASEAMHKDDKRSSLYDDLLGRQPIDTIWDTETFEPSLLPSGHYMQVSAAGPELLFSYLEVNKNFHTLVPSQDRLALMVMDSMGHAVPDTKALFKKNMVPYNEDKGFYQLKKKKRKGRISIVTAGDTSFFDFHRGKEYNRTYGKRWPLRGYMAFNQPKYRPGDTVKLKTYFTNKKGKPRNIKKVKVTIGGLMRQRGIIFREEKITASARGTFLYEFPLTDSFDADQIYSVALHKRRWLGRRYKKTLWERSFKIEDYQLDRINWALQAEDSSWKAGSEPAFVLTGRNANGQLLMDGRAEISLLLEDVKNIYTERAFIPDTLWKWEGTVPTDGVLRLNLPADTLPLADMALNLYARCLNGNNEPQIIITSIQYKAMAASPVANIAKKDLKIDCRGCSAQQKNSANLIMVSASGATVEKAIKLPYSYPLQGWETTAFIQANGKEEIKDIHALIEPRVSGDRKGDSLIANITNPTSLPISYKLWAENELVKEGILTDSVLTYVSDTKKTLSLEYEHEWAGQRYHNHRDWILPDRKLHIALNVPEEIKPGEKVKVEVAIQDWKGRPVPGANITAGAVTKEFGKDHVPEVPDLRRNMIPRKHKYHWRVQNKNKPYVWQQADKPWLHKLGADTQAYYKFTFPTSQLQLVYEPTGSPFAEFAPFIFNMGSEETIVTIKINDRIIYYCGIYSFYPYSLYAYEGLHTITLRTKTKEYAIKDVEIKKGFKLFISLDANYLPANIAVKKVKNKLSKYEAFEILQIYSYVTSNVGKGILWTYDSVAYILEARDDYGYYSRAIRVLNYVDSLHYENENSIGWKFEFSGDKSYVLYQDHFEVSNNFLGDVRQIRKIEHNEPRFFYRFRQDKLLNLGQAREILSSQKKQTQYQKIYREKARSYTFLYTGKIALSHVILKYDSVEIIRPYNMASLNFEDLREGNYRLYLVSAKGNTTLADSFTLSKKGIYFRKTDDKIWKKEFNNDKVLIRLAKATKEGSTLLLRVKDHQGIPIDGAIVDLSTVVESVNYNWRKTDINGICDIAAIQPGQYIISVWAPGRSQFTCKVDFDSISREIKLEMRLFKYDMASRSSVHNAVTARPSSSTISPLPGWQYNNNWYGYEMGYSHIGRSGRNGRKIAYDNLQEVIYTENKYNDLTTYYNFQQDLNPNKPGHEFGYYDSDYYDDMDSFRGNVYAPRGQSAHIRTLFSDYAYWQPLLFTDANGKASFDVSFPENTTTWQSFAVAMTENGSSGEQVEYTRAVKSMLAELAMPRFAIQGDSLTILAKAMNYTGQPRLIKTSFDNGQGGVINETHEIKDLYMRPYGLRVNTADELPLKFSFSSDSLGDGELRKLPVYRQGLEVADGSFLMLKKDTSFSLNFDPNGGPVQVYAADNMLEDMLQVVGQLQDYPYDCNEQKASKIKALVAEEAIRNSRGESFRHSRMLRKLVEDLYANRNNEGYWGWWGKSQKNMEMTLYVMEAMQQGKGYLNAYAMNGIYAQLVRDFSKAPPQLAVDIMAILSKGDYYFDFAKGIEQISYDSLDTYHKLQYMLVCQRRGLPYDKQQLVQLHNKDIYGGWYYPGNEKNIFHTGMRSTLLAYELGSMLGDAEVKQHIMAWVLSKRTWNGWRNTLETASALAAILPDLAMEESNGKVQISVRPQAGDALLLAQAGKTEALPARKISITKSGSGPAWVSAWQTRFDEKPVKQEDLFRVRSSFTQEGQAVNELKAGKPAEMRIEVEVLAEADYIMIEAPIPAGCSYEADNEPLVVESQREYLKDKLNISCEKLKPGKYTFTIKLQPRYAGSYILNPVKAASMYFPLLSGNNVISRISIHE